jgi:hypothetical protein
MTVSRQSITWAAFLACLCFSSREAPGAVGCIGDGRRRALIELGCGEKAPAAAFREATSGCCSRKLGIVLLMGWRHVSEPTGRGGPAGIRRMHASCRWRIELDDARTDLSSTHWNRGETKISARPRLAWIAWCTTRSGRLVTGTPVIADGTVYLVSNGLVALQLATGALLWQPRASRALPRSRSDGVLYFFYQSAWFALRARSGATLAACDH